MMNRQDKTRAGIVGHRHRLLRCAVAADPWVVCADWKHRQVELPIRSAAPPQPPEKRRVRRVAGEEHGHAIAPQNIPAVAPVIIRPHPRAPVPNLNRLDLQLARRIRLRHALIPTHFGRRVPQKIGCAPRSDEPRLPAETSQRRQVEVVHVRVTEQDQIDPRQLAEPQRGRNVPLWTNERHRPAEAYAFVQGGVSEDRDPAEVQQNGRVTQP